MTLVLRHKFTAWYSPYNIVYKLKDYPVYCNLHLKKRTFGWLVATCHLKGSLLFLLFSATDVSKPL